MTARTRAGAHARRNYADTSLPNRQRVERRIAKAAATKAARAEGARDVRQHETLEAGVAAALAAPYHDPIDRTVAALDAALGRDATLLAGLFSRAHRLVEQWPGGLVDDVARLACARALLRITHEPAR